MFPLDVQKAMHMGRTHALYHNSSVHMSHHDTLGIVTADSIKNKDLADTSAIADNPPVAGSAGASDPQIAEAVRGIRARTFALGSDDRTSKDSGMVDASKFRGDDVGPTFVTGLAARLHQRKVGKR